MKKRLSVVGSRLPALGMAAVVILFTSLAVITGCNHSGAGGDPAPIVAPDAPASPAQIAANASLIKLGASTAVFIGLSALADPQDALQQAQLASDALNNDLLPVLHGENAGLAHSVSDLLTLNALNDPRLVKVRALLEAALPLLRSNLPPGAPALALDKLPDDLRAYLTAFFDGAAAGLDQYILAETPALAARRNGRSLRRRLSNLAGEL